MGIGGVRWVGIVTVAMAGTACSEPAARADAPQKTESFVGHQQGDHEPERETHVARETGGATVVLAESVQIVMSNGTDYCTGVLVNERTVVTAAHCLLSDPSWTHWTVHASLAQGSPTSRATRYDVLSESYDDPAHGDVGVLHLDTPIRIAAYARLKDVSREVDAGAKLRAVAVGRKTESPMAALEMTAPLEVTSAVSLGYETGLKSALYSGGGDSGGGLFLLDASGRPTHDVIGFARQPDFDRNVDYFTRVDQALIDLIGGR